MVGIYGVTGPSAARRGEALRRMSAAAGREHRGSPHVWQGPGLAMVAYPRPGQDGGESVLDRADVRIFVSGHFFHPKLTAETGAALVGRLLDEGGGAERLGECVGEFAVVVVDKRTGEVALITDYLGVRPLFYAVSGEGVLFGTNVWPMFDSGEIAPVLDPDGLASWLVLNHPQGTSTLFRDIQKVPAASVLRCRGAVVTATPYARVEAGAAPSGDLPEQVHDIVSRTCRGLTRGLRSVAVLLSGGFDSRYVACLARQQGLDCTALTVPYESGDAALTPVVAERLGMPLRSIPVPGSLDDAYGDPVRWAASGFPVGKHVTCLPIERFGITAPTLDGFIGDRLLRGLDADSRSTLMLKLARQRGSLREAACEVEQLLEPEAMFLRPLAARVRARVVAQAGVQLSAMDGPDERKASLWLLQNRKANWISNNHLQYLDATEGLHPLYSRELIDLHLGGARFTWALYEELFQRYYPEVADIPHSRQIEPDFHAAERWSWFNWRRAPALLGDVMSAAWAQGSLDRGRVLPRVTAYATGVSRWGYVVRYLHQLATLMRRLGERGIPVDWKAV